MKIRRVILGFAISLNLMLLSLALRVNYRTSQPAVDRPQLTADGIPLPPPPPNKNG